ncbi:MAG: hypothetical protein JWL81_2619 [Verrucomicrobiales bacterium]|nr:hypothetical protein [Verrucomicrobiales bacterium]
MNPIIIISPLARAGTTLVQRLLCSSPGALIFGDAVGQEMEFFAKYAQLKAAMFAPHAGMVGGLMSAVMAGDTAHFLSPLSPLAAAGGRAWEGAAKAWLKVCQEEAVAAGRPVWGWKLAGADPLSLPVLSDWFPQAKWIWVERDPADCLRSAKAAGMISGAPQVAHFAGQAAALVRAFTAMAGRALVIRHEDLVAHGVSVLRRLEDFTGAADLDASVLNVRINQSGTREVLAPENLSDDETEAMLTAGPLLLSTSTRMAA